MADHEKIKTCFAQIIVNNSEDKPYYSIMYWENGEMNIGFSSYRLDYVRHWLVGSCCTSIPRTKP